MNKDIVIEKGAIFVSGIDTDAGKTYATAWLMRALSAQGRTTISQKFIQTGCVGSSEDIEAHRRLCGVDMCESDIDGTTAPVIFSYPASAQLAARIDGRDIDISIIRDSTRKLLEKYDTVFIEGAGGLMVPLSDSYFAIDYVADNNLPLILVTNGRLGSINHTVLSLETIRQRGLKLQAVVYNTFFDADKTIAADTLGFINRYLNRHFPQTRLFVMPPAELW